MKKYKDRVPKSKSIGDSYVEKINIKTGRMKMLKILLYCTSRRSQHR